MRLRGLSLFHVLVLALVPLASAQGLAAGSAAPNYDVREDNSQAGIAAAAFQRRSQADQAQLSDRLQAAMSHAEADLRSDLPTLIVDYGRVLASPVAVGTQTADRFLTRPSDQSREAIFRQFLGQHAALFGLSAAQLDDWVTTQDYTNPAGNLSFVSLQQQVNGLDVFACELSAAFSAKNELARIRGNVSAGVDESSAAVAAQIDARQAIATAAASIEVALKPADLRERSADARTVVFAGGIFKRDIEARQLYFPLKPGTLTLAWSFVLWQDVPAYWVIVDAESGALLWRKNITNDQTVPASYDVYTDDSPAPLSPTNATPGSGIQGGVIPRTTVTLIGNEPPNTFNQLGWIGDGDNTTDGNNVQAGLDRDGMDGVDATGMASGSPARVFSFAYNPAPGGPPPGEDPLMASSQMGAVTNMFYWTNLYHDRLYRLGFTEPARNFQNDNFGLGGLQGDRISAEVQDSSGTNNANFGTPSDGGRGRMQMYLFTNPTPQRDGDLDADVFLHEMTHGTSNRLIGNGGGLFNNRGGSMGEGWSDFYGRAILSTPGENINGVYAPGPYVTLNFLSIGTDNYYYGIRRFPYALMTTTGGPLNRPHNPLTFADIDPAQINTTDGAYPASPWIPNSANEVHNAGEVWCMTLLEVRARIINSLGFAAGNERMLQIVTDGMKLTPTSPNFIQARDAIMAADQAGFGGADMPAICAGFAARGMGIGAVDGGVSVIQSFSASANLGLGTVTFNDAAGNGNGFADPGESLVLAVPLLNPPASACGSSSATGTTATISGNTANYGTINPGSTVSQPINYAISPAATCGSVVNVPVAINSSLGPTTASFPLAIGQPLFNLTQNFDGVIAPTLPAGWATAQTGTPALWVTSTTTPDTAPNATFTDNPSTSGESQLVTPTFLVTSPTTRLTFRHNFITEQTYDGGVLEIKIGAGAFQDILAAGGTFASGGYNGTITTVAGSGCPSSPNPLATRAAWTGTSNGYITTVVNLPAAANGQNVQLRWRFGSDCIIGATGWRVDTIDVIAGFACSAVPNANLAITNTDAQTTAVPGASVTYTLVASNAGPDASGLATVSDPFPSLSGVSWNCAATPGSICPASGAGSLAASVSLAPGGSATFNATGTILPAATGSLVNTALVTPPVGVTDPVTSNNSATDTDVLTPQADFSITKTDGQLVATPGSAVAYTIAATHNGPSVSAPATVTDNVPAVLAGLTWTCTATSGSSCPASGKGSFSELVDLAPGGTATFVVNGTLSPSATGTLSNTASVTAPGSVTDLVPGNNTATDTDNVTLDVTELGHGSVLIRDLRPSGTVPAEHFYWLSQKPYSSYEAVVDATSGDIGRVELARLDGHAAIVLQSSVGISGIGFSRSLRFINNLPVQQDGELLRVRSGSCSSDCGPDDVYRIRLQETTGRITRFNNSATQVTVVLLQNPSSDAVAGTIYFWRANGMPAASQPFTLAAKGVVVLNSAAVPGLAGNSGSITIVHNGAYGALIGKAVALEPGTGFSFDSPMTRPLQ